MPVPGEGRSTPYGTSPSASIPASSTGRALEALHQVRCARLDRGDPHGDARGDDPRLGAGAYCEAGRGPTRRASLDLRRRPRRGGVLEGATSSDDLDDGVRRTGAAAAEKETLGIFVSEHPLERVRADLRRKTDCALMDIERRRDGDIVTVGGIVSGLKQVTTKRGDPMVFATLDDPTGSAEVVVFNSTYASSRELLEPDRILVVKGRVDHKQAGETKLVALEVSPFEIVAVRREVRLRIDARQAPAGLIRELATLVSDFPGDALVYVALETSVGERTLALGLGSTG